MYRVVAQGVNEIMFNQALFEIADEFNINLYRPVKFINQTFHFLVPKMYVNQIDDLMYRFGIQDQLHQPLERKDGKLLFNDEVDSADIPFDEDVILKKYLSYEESVRYVDLIVSKIQQNNPNIVARSEVVGNSYENRQIIATTLQYKDMDDNPIILIDALIHARERHAGSAALFALKSLSEEASKDVDGILYKATFVIINMLNPDGYEYNLTKEPFWRKTMKPSNEVAGCVGVDGNRNFDVHWDEGKREKLPCDEVS